MGVAVDEPGDDRHPGGVDPELRRGVGGLERRDPAVGHRQPARLERLLGELLAAQVGEPVLGGPQDLRRAGDRQRPPAVHLTSGSASSIGIASPLPRAVSSAVS